MTPPLSDPPEFRAKLRQDLEPIIRHTAAAVVIEASLLAIGGVGWGLKRLFASQQTLFEYFELVDLLIAFLLLCLYGFSALALVAISLLDGVVEAWLNRKRG